MRRPGRALGVIVVAIAALAMTRTAGSQPPVNYVYDALGRLTAVIDPQGDVGVYHYDAVGNLLSIERVTVSTLPGNVAISLVTPNQGKVGTTVAIFGKGFSGTPSQNTVTFNGTPATVTDAAPTRLVSTVPPGATTGPIALTAPLGNATSPNPFTVISVTGPLVVTPTMALVLPNHTQQFGATLNGTPTSVLWSVNGIPGGDATIGTISPMGLYTAPSTQALAIGVTITATHAEDTFLSASATVAVIVPRPVTTAASVALAEPAATVSSNLTAAISVQNAPAVTGLSPSSAVRGTNDLTVTVTGKGFSNATAVTFRLGNAADSNIIISDLTVISDTELTVVVDVASGAALGARVVRVTTTAGAATVGGTGGNIFMVQ
jgi:YD repeat-containing protein